MIFIHIPKKEKISNIEKLSKIFNKKELIQMNENKTNIN